MTRWLAFISTLAALLAAPDTLAGPSFRAQTFEFVGSAQATCSPEQKKSAIAELSALGLSEAGDVGDRPLAADLSANLVCAAGVRMVRIGTESVPERTFSATLTLRGNFGAQFEQSAPTVKGAFANIEPFLNEHAAGCSISAGSASEFQLIVDSEKNAADKLQFALSTPYLLRGLKAGQAFSIQYGGKSIAGCGASGEQRLTSDSAAAAGASGGSSFPGTVAAAGAGGASSVPNTRRTPLAWALFAAAALALVPLLFWIRSRKRLKLPIFISYRRDDSGGHAARLFEGLKRVFDPKLVFMDSSSIPLGKNFEASLEQAISTSRVMLIVIGKQWQKELDARLQTTDYVRMEVATALEQPNCDVVPILINDARLPSAAELPPDLAELPLRQAYALRSDERWDSDVRALIERLKPLLPRP